LSVSSRMLKKSASFVLGSSKASTYPRGYASGFDSPAALLNGLFEHPDGLLTCGTAQLSSSQAHVRTIEGLTCQHRGFLQPFSLLQEVQP